MHIAPDLRHIAIALPAKNEEQDLPACLAALDLSASRHKGPVTVVAVANDCTDATVAILRDTRLRHARLRWHAVSMLPGARHAGWARRLAFDAAAAALPCDMDILASTDADTCVAPDWIVRMIAHFDAGSDAVAGRALTRRIDRAGLGAAAARRLNLLGRYYTALDWLRADLAATCHDPWPRHFYEGGASIALTRGLYRRIGGAPTPSVAEDRALFAAVRRVGGQVRHPLDVRVFTSSRIEGRAPGGMAEAFAGWITQAEDAPLHETYAFPMALNPAGAVERDRLSFATLPAAIATAGAMIRARRSAAAPQVEPILVPTLLADDRDGIAQQRPELGDRRVA
jgi:cellulose synthase/poly-beta-1,6-N-acetylglucosamine synthase-like glycosyltransferase